MSSSDADFSSEVELSITIPESELRGARDEIESSIGSVPVSTDGGRATAGARGRQLRPRFVRQNLRGQVNRLGEIEAQGERRNRLLSEVLEAVGGGAARSSGGDALGGADDVLGDFVGDFGGEVAGDAIDTATDIATDLSDSVTDAISTGLGNFAGNIAANLLTGGGSVGVDKPDWVPIQVEEPAPIPVDTPSSEIPVEDVGPIKVSVESATRPTAGPVFRPRDANGGGTEPEPEGTPPFGTFARKQARNFRQDTPALLNPLATGTGTLFGLGQDIGARLPGTPDRPKTADPAEGDTEKPQSPFRPRGRRPTPAASGGLTVNITNQVDVGVEQPEVERIVESELERFERRLERQLSRGR